MNRACRGRRWSSCCKNIPAPEKQGDTGLYHVARIKQWLGYLRKEYTEALTLFNEIRALQTSAEIAAAIGRY